MDPRLHFTDVVAIRDPDGGAPRLFFQRVPEAKVAKNRVHLDVPVPPDELESEVDRLSGLGASLSSTANILGTAGLSCKTPKATSSASTDPMHSATNKVDDVLVETVWVETVWGGRVVVLPLTASVFAADGARGPQWLLLGQDAEHQHDHHRRYRKPDDAHNRLAHGFHHRLA